MIVKIQRPISPPDGPYLLYNKDRSFMQQMPQTQWLNDLMDKDLKRYFNATRERGTIRILERVPDQDW